MLHDNFIYGLLFDIGYTGLENVYEYYQENKDILMRFIKKYYPSILDNQDIWEDFELKIRWKSNLGIKIKSAIRKKILLEQYEDVFDFEEIKVRFDKKYYNIRAFSDMFPYMNEKLNGRLDLRGISFYKLVLKNVKFQNLDFSKATFNCASLENIKFFNVNITDTLINYSELRKSSFDKECVLLNTDFSSSLIESHFDCSIVSPVLTFPDKNAISSIISGDNQSWKAYTHIIGTSFIDNTINYDLMDQMITSQESIKKAYDTLGTGKRLLMLLKYKFGRI